jgi:protein LTV1
LEHTLPDAASERPNVGEAAEYGVYFDDTDYDYMQHLRPVGMTADAIMLEAPATKGKGKGKAKEDIFLPDESLPSQNELSLAAARDAMQSVPSELSGFNPDLDQHLRQTLEALEDDAFVENNDAPGEADLEDIFGELLGEGARREGEKGEWDGWEFREEGVGATMIGPSQDAGKDDLTSRVAAFKKSQAQASEALSDDEQKPDHSEGGDTIGRLPSLPPLSVIGGKRRRKGAGSDASGFSMSSSSMFRNDGLRGLDAQFDRVSSFTPIICWSNLWNVNGIDGSALWLR